jgi:hypothetical protein
VRGVRVASELKYGLLDAEHMIVLRFQLREVCGDVVATYSVEDPGEYSVSEATRRFSEASVTRDDIKGLVDCRRRGEVGRLVLYDDYSWQFTETVKAEAT